MPEGLTPTFGSRFVPCFQGDSFATLFVVDTPPHVLIVDDDDEHALMTARLLRHEGFTVTTWRGAFGASIEARTIQPDVVLLDVEMPALSGDRLAPLLRESTSGQATLIVLHSSRDEADLRAIATETGADGYIPKGTAGPAMAAKLRGWLEARGQGA
ncbi:MAG: hypothetical protein CMN29_10810 [Sandaracinus sp.]|nr:hypothetical protein [Sandaracinus sp.]